MKSGVCPAATKQALFEFLDPRRYAGRARVDHHSAASARRSGSPSRGFDAERVASFRRGRSHAPALADPGIVRNRAKIDAASGSRPHRSSNLRARARWAEDVLWSDVDGVAVQNRFSSMAVRIPPEQPAVRTYVERTCASGALRLVGPTICCALMQAAGLDQRPPRWLCPRHDASRCARQRLTRGLVEGVARLLGALSTRRSWTGRAERSVWPRTCLASGGANDRPEPGALPRLTCPPARGAAWRAAVLAADGRLVARRRCAAGGAGLTLLAAGRDARSESPVCLWDTPCSRGAGCSLSRTGNWEWLSLWLQHQLAIDGGLTTALYEPSGETRMLDAWVGERRRASGASLAGNGSRGPPRIRSTPGVPAAPSRFCRLTRSRPAARVSSPRSTGGLRGP